MFRKSSVASINSGNTYYNINNSGRDVIINNGFREEPKKTGENSETFGQAEKSVVRKNNYMNDKKVPCDGCGILKEPFFLDEYSNGKKYCIRCR